jgi:hypothetical protein
MGYLVVVYDPATGLRGGTLVNTSLLQDNAVTSGKIGSGAIGPIHFAPFTSGYVVIGQGASATPVYGFPPAGTPGDGTVTSSKIASGAVGTPHIAGQAITSALVAAGLIGQAAIEFVIDGGQAVITSGIKGHYEIVFPATINRATLLCDQSGNINIDIYKSTYAGFSPTASICSGAWPHTSGNIKYQDTVLSNWVTAIASGDILAFVANNASSIQRCTVSLGVYK